MQSSKHHQSNDRLNINENGGGGLGGGAGGGFAPVEDDQRYMVNKNANFSKPSDKKFFKSKIDFSAPIRSLGRNI